MKNNVSIKALLPALLASLLVSCCHVSSTVILVLPPSPSQDDEDDVKTFPGKPLRSLETISGARNGYVLPAELQRFQNEGWTVMVINGEWSTNFLAAKPSTKKNSQ